MDEADIHRAAEQAAAAAAAAADHHQQQQQQQQPHLEQEDAAPDAAECEEGWTQQRRDDVRLFAELASYCSTITSDSHATTSAEPDVDDIVVSRLCLFT